MNIKIFRFDLFENSRSGLDEKDNVKVVTGFIQEAIDEHFKLIMIRPDMVSLASQMVSDASSNLQIGYRFSRRKFNC
jgi:deoxyribose-phosphate aldolase